MSYRAVAGEKHQQRRSSPAFYSYRLIMSDARSTVYARVGVFHQPPAIEIFRYRDSLRSFIFTGYASLYYWISL